MSFYDLPKLLGTGAGKPAWVLGSGPSLLAQDPKELSGVILGVNHAVWLAERRGFPRLDHWFFLDLPFVEEVDVRDYANPRTRIWTDLVAGAFLRGRGLKQGRDYQTVELGSCLTPSREDEKLHTRNSTVGIALHFAWILGCNPIHLRGVDLKHDAKGRRHWWDAPGSHAEGESKDFDHQREYLHSLISTIRAAGTAVTVRAAEELANSPYVPFWEREPVLGAVKGV